MRVLGRELRLSAGHVLAVISVTFLAAGLAPSPAQAAQAAAKPTRMTVKAFKKLARPKQLAIFKAYREFVGQLEGANPQWFADAGLDPAARKAWLDAAAELFGEAIVEAQESGDSALNCFNAGWPNAKNSGGRCPGPGVGAGKAFFNSLGMTNNCQPGETPCDPIFFGSGFCFSPTKNYPAPGGQSVHGPGWAWYGCSKTSTKSIDEILDEILDNPKLQKGLDTVFEASNKACKKPSPSTAGMCHALMTKRDAIVNTAMGRTGHFYDCYRKSVAITERKLEAAGKKPTSPGPGWTRYVEDEKTQALKATNDPQPMNSCSEYQDAQGTKRNWCRGLPMGYVAAQVGESGKSGVMVTNLDPSSDTGVNAVFVPGKGDEEQEQGLMYLSREDFMKRITPDAKSGVVATPYSVAHDINQRRVMTLISGLSLPDTCPGTDIKPCQEALSACVGIKGEDALGPVVKDVCSTGRFAQTPGCPGGPALPDNYNVTGDDDHQAGGAGG